MFDVRNSRLATVAFLLAANVPVHAALPGGISGTWYNPSQSGHGISLEILSPVRAVALWHVFDQDGRPLTLYVDGQVDGHRIQGPAYAPKGMRFGDFDPATLQLPLWGQVTINVDSCDSAQLSWSTEDPNFGNGEINLTRLSGAEGLECQLLPALDLLAVGLYNGETESTGNRPSPIWLSGIVDREGRLWGYEYAYAQARNPFPIPGPYSVGLTAPSVIEATPIHVDGETVDVRTAIRVGGALSFGRLNPAVVTGSGQWTGSTAQFEPVQGALTKQVQSWRVGPTPTARLVTGVTGGTLEGTYRVQVRNQFGDALDSLEIDADGTTCYRRPDDFDPAHCWLGGKVTAAEGAIGLLDFELADLSNPALAGYRGRGWLQESETGRQLILVGDNGTQGFLLTGKPE